MQGTKVVDNYSALFNFLWGTFKGEMGIPAPNFQAGFPLNVVNDPVAVRVQKFLKTPVREFYFQLEKHTFYKRFSHKFIRLA